MAAAITIDRANVPYFRSHRILQFEIAYENEILTVSSIDQSTASIHLLFTLLRET